MIEKNGFQLLDLERQPIQNTKPFFYLPDILKNGIHINFPNTISKKIH